MGIWDYLTILQSNYMLDLVSTAPQIQLSMLTFSAKLSAEECALNIILQLDQQDKIQISLLPCENDASQRWPKHALRMTFV